MHSSKKAILSNFYTKRVSEYKVLSKGEELQLTSFYYETKDEKTKERLVYHNLRLVIKIASKYKFNSENFLDIIQEGTLGLMRAIEKFNPYLGVPLGSYAAGWIKAYILKYTLESTYLVRIGTTKAQRKLFYVLKKEKAKLEGQGISLTQEQLAARLDVKVQELSEMEQRLSSPELSLDTSSNNNEDDSNGLINSLEKLSARESGTPEKIFENLENILILKENINKFKLSLNDAELLILEKRMTSDEPETLEQIGLKLNLTKERIRQIEKKVKDKLHRYCIRKNISP
jgi:RNA polymerase sigma-32 factor